MPLDGLVLGGALLSGLLGGAHCASMCGGIATGFSTRQRGGWWIALQPNLGRIGGYALARLVGSAIPDVKVPGALPILGAAAVLLAAALIASLLPAARAARVDVMEALRSE